MSAQTDPQFLERDEFYLALRLIALAQNNLEVSEESIRINHPIPPLPKIDLKNNSTQANNSSSGLDQSNMSIIQSPPEKDEYTITEENDNKYTLLFNKNKDNQDKISIKKINEMFIAANIQTDTIKKIFDIVQVSDPKFLNLSEFKVIFHLIYTSYVTKDVPLVLPASLKYVLNLGNKGKFQDIDFMADSVSKNLTQSK